MGDNFLVFYRTGDNFLGNNLEEKLDGRQIFPKQVDGRQKIFGGRASPNYHPSVHTGGDVT